ncbi:unnamed protein product [Dicrocoelium dendriticum]|nr:unnamed protein product [Dicrocoelium dendriticum]
MFRVVRPQNAMACFLLMTVTCYICVLVIVRFKLPKQYTPRGLNDPAIYHTLMKGKSCFSPLASMHKTVSTAIPVLPVCSTSSVNKQLVWMERGVLHIAPVNDTSRVCSALPIYRIDDYKSVYGEGIDDVTDGFVPRWPSFMLLCQPRANLEIRRGLPWKKDLFREQDRTFVCGSFPPVSLIFGSRNIAPVYNILLLGLDSISQRAAAQYLPKTMQLLDSWPSAYTMKWYNVIGDGTTANLMALLTGRFEHELPEARKSRIPLRSNGSVLDSYPWIWKEFERAGGYATHSIEDSPKWGTFQFRLTGFGAKKTPTHSYGRPCMLAAAQDEQQYGKQLGCTTSRYTHHVLLESLREFFHAYADHPKFSLTFMSEMIHENPAYAIHLDEDIMQLLKQVRTDDEETNSSRNQKPFANTILILFSDHGPRMGEARLSVQGKLDERLPLLSIMVPRRLRLSWPDAVKHLNANQDRLVTLFDVHSTLQHVLTQQYGPRYGGKMARSTRGYSLFSEINSDRTCAQASIAAHWCSCLEWRPLLHSEENMLYLKRRNGHPLSTAAINMTVTQYLNERIRILRSHIQEGWPTCSDIQVTKVSPTQYDFKSMIRSIFEVNCTLYSITDADGHQLLVA